ncbi:COP9 signalosome complex subunit 6b [Vitis vinifera]|uniref:COP9 signalosome complex subunit 6b n=1 Tax=Vitis vinifera TaxID=29760 RepID=A0A438FL69_VITVI|nr:COP9 signalosome complex subunit 6b [Vitis vinifera]
MRKKGFKRGQGAEKQTWRDIKRLRSREGRTDKCLLPDQMIYLASGIGWMAVCMPMFIHCPSMGWLCSNLGGLASNMFFNHHAPNSFTDFFFGIKLMDINESPVYVLLNPSINHAQKDLPVTIYESGISPYDENVVCECLFKLAWCWFSGKPDAMPHMDPSCGAGDTLRKYDENGLQQTVEAERISVDHVAHLKPSDGGSAATQLAAHLTGIHSAIKMLNSRIRVLHHYLLAMQKGVCLFCLFRNLNLFKVLTVFVSFDVGDIPCENSLLRQVSSLLRRLPAIESGKFQDDFLMEYNDTLLISYLAMFTNCSRFNLQACFDISFWLFSFSTMNELVDKFNTAYDRHSRRGGRTAFI